MSSSRGDEENKIWLGEFEKTHSHVISEFGRYGPYELNDESIRLLRQYFYRANQLSVAIYGDKKPDIEAINQELRFREAIQLNAETVKLSRATARLSWAAVVIAGGALAATLVQIWLQLRSTR
jgi:hypothetical protein